MSFTPRAFAPPFTDQSVINKVRATEDAWNTRDLANLALAYTIDCQWRDRTEFLWGREQLKGFMTRRLRVALEHRSVLEPWAWRNNRIAIRFAVEFQNDRGAWFRGFGNENWECDANGLVSRCLTSVNEHSIKEHERVLIWPAGVRPADFASLSELGL